MGPWHRPESGLVGSARSARCGRCRISPEETRQALAYDDSDLREGLEETRKIVVSAVRELQGANERLRALEEVKSAIVDDYQRMRGLESQFGKKLNVTQDAVLEGVGKLEARVDKLDRDLAREVQAIQALRSLDSDMMRQQVASLYDAFGAVYHRERLHELAEKIETKGELLLAPTHSKADLKDAGRWEQWEQLQRSWRVDLNQWCDLATAYFPGINDKVLPVTAEDLEQTGEAQLEQFPSAEAFNAYKAFCVRLMRRRNWEADAERAVHQIAFNGGAAGSRPIFPGAGHLEEIGTRRG